MIEIIAGSYSIPIIGLNYAVHVCCVDSVKEQVQY